jgi:hypothetical protein
MANLFRSDGFFIVIIGGKGVDDCPFPCWGIHAAALKGAVLAGTLVNLEPAVTTHRASAMVVGAGFLDNFQLVEVFENIKCLSHQPSPPVEGKM